MARDFGALGFWHLVPGAPQRCSRKEKAQALLEMWHEKRWHELMPSDPKKGPDIFRAMVLELAVGDDGSAPEITDLIAKLVETAMPKWVYAVLDPVHVYSGDGAGPGNRRQIAWRRLENLCLSHDRRAVRATGQQLSVNELVEKLARDVEADVQLNAGVSHLRAEAPAFDRTINKWRKKPGYLSDIQAVRMIWENGQDT